jgi:hypothetical protein
MCRMTDAHSSLPFVSISSFVPQISHTLILTAPFITIINVLTENTDSNKSFIRSSSLCNNIYFDGKFIIESSALERNDFFDKANKNYIFWIPYHLS